MCGLLDGWYIAHSLEDRVTGALLENTHSSTRAPEPYRGAIAAHVDSPQLRQSLQALPRLLADDKLEVLSAGADRVVKMFLPTARGKMPVAVKVFKRQGLLKDWSDCYRKSKAERSWRLATYCQQAGVGTPIAIAWLDKWRQGRLMESYYICEYIQAPSFTDLLADIFYRQRDNAPLIEVLHRVAPAVRVLHDAGVAHGDLGNQNILLPTDDNGIWCQPLFIDLNRARIKGRALTQRERARDISRIFLTSPYLKIFKHIYFDHGRIPRTFDRWEKHYRRRFAWHNRTRYLRHPLRTIRQGKWQEGSPYPPVQNIWLWDEKSAQPTIALGSSEKRLLRLQHLPQLARDAWQSSRALPAVMRRYRQVLAESFTAPVTMAGGIGVALHPHSENLERELQLLAELGNPPVLLRFCHHESPQQWQQTIDLVTRLQTIGVEVMAALLQDREAVLSPQKWAHFLQTVIGAIADKVAAIEVAHAPNRVKWGVWTADEYAQLLAPALAIKAQFPHIKITGPACIDFEYHRIVGALQALPDNARLDGLSHLLYVDRRGAPEEKQGGYSTLEKCALLKALAECSDKTESRVIISEVNWPLQHTGIYSPVGSPYTAPEWFDKNPGETEGDYANYMLRYLAISLCSGHVDKVYWWRLSAHGYGLADDRDDYRKRPAFIALQFFLEFLGEACFIKSHSHDGLYCLEFEKPQQKVFMVWTVKQPEKQGELAEKNLPLTECQSVLDREGRVLREWEISDSPLYLVFETM